jgi:hypothetical protein
MRSAALLEKIRGGASPVPILDLDLYRGSESLGRKIISTRMFDTDLGYVDYVAPKQGWSTVTIGNGIAKAELTGVSTSVLVGDRKGTLIDFLETYDPRGSAARIHRGLPYPALASADWERIFTGILEDWGREDPYTKLFLKVDDTAMRRPVPSGLLDKTLWGSASETSLYGIQLPLLMGIHDSSQITARGAVPAINIRYDKDLGYWWLLSVDRQIDVTKIYYAGVPQGTGGWSVQRGVHGSNYLTILVVAEGYQPAEGVVVSFDCQGPDENGLVTGGPLTGAPDQLRAIINEYGYNDPPLSGWRGDTAAINASAWNLMSEFFALHEIEAAIKFGGSQKPVSVAECIQSFLDAYGAYVRIWWNEYGQLDALVIDSDDLEPVASKWVRLNLKSQDAKVPYTRGDRKEVYTGLKMSFMFLDLEQKLMQAYVATKLSALRGEKNTLSVENYWSQGRYTRSGPPLNPSAPADPVHP